jgi:hypothetical protein
LAAELPHDLLALSETLSLFHVTGDDDYLLLVAVASTEHLQRFVLDRLLRRPEVDRVRTLIVYQHRHKDVTPRRLARQDGGEPPMRWLLAEWPLGEPAPTKYWLSNLPATTPLVELVRLARSRWRVEQDYRELKGALGRIISKAAAGWAGTTTSPWCRSRTAFDPGAAATPQNRRGGLTLWQLLEQLQVLLACWAGACPVCKRPAPRWLRRTGRPQAPT